MAGDSKRTVCPCLADTHPSPTSPFPGHPQNEGTKKAPHPPTRGRDRVSVTLGAALCSPGRKPRVGIWRLLAHLLARIIEHQLLPAKGGIQEADLGPWLEILWHTERALALWVSHLLPTVE